MASRGMVAIAGGAAAAVLAIALVSAFQAGDEPGPAAEPKLGVISSFYPIHEFVQNIGGDKIDATLLIPVGAEPHDWEPTIRDVERIQSADIIVINGIGFERWVEDLKEEEFGGVIVDTSMGIEVIMPHEDEDEHGDEHNDEREEEHGDEHGDENGDEHGDEHNDEHNDEREEEHGDEHGHDHSGGDPHIWLSPVHAQAQVQNIADAFADADPGNAIYYQSNAAAYITQLDALDSGIRAGLADCNTDFIAFHDAFSYFAAEYGLTQHTILSSSDPHGEVTARSLENVISKAREINQSIVFGEEAANPKTTQVIADEIGGKVLVLSPLEIHSERSYIERMGGNLENLREALCQ